MTKVFALLSRRPDVSAERFHEHWRTVHREHALRIRRLRGYVQAHRIDPDLPGLPAAPYEGIAQVWFDDVHSALAQRDDPDYLRYAKLDEPEFIDTATISRIVANQEMVAGTADDSGVKAMILIGGADKAPDALAADAKAFGNRLSELCPHASGVGLAIALPPSSPAGPSPYDAVAEIWWDARAAQEADWAAGRETVPQAIGRVGDPERSVALLCEELRVIWPPGGRR